MTPRIKRVRLLFFLSVGATACALGPLACSGDDSIAVDCANGRCADASASGDASGEGASPGDGGANDAKTDAAPVHGFFDVRGHGAKGDGTTDDTKAIQTTIGAAAAAGGGIVLFPAGRYRITATLDVGTAVTLGGEGFQPPEKSAPASLAGSWLVIDAAFLNKPAISLSGGGATVRDLGVWHEQPNPGPGFSPRAFGWTIDMAVPDTLTRHVWLANPTLGVHGIGRTTIEDVQGEPITTGISIDTAYDVVRIRKIRFDWTADGLPVWSSDPSVTSKLGVGIESLRNDNPEIYDVKIAGYNTGIHYGASGAGVTSKFAMMDTYVSNSARCVTIDGANTTGKLDRFFANGCGTTGIWITGAGSVVSGADLDLREIGANAVRIEAANSFFLVNQLTVVNWDKGNGGFPAIEAANGSATAKVGLFHSLTGGNVQFGGVGKVTTDTNAGDSTFDLRVATPTSPSESGPTPFSAQIDVLAYGAKGDGKADDTQAIQAALDAAAASGGGAVVVPAGDYHLKGSLHVPPHVTLVGIGWQGQGGAVNGNDGTMAEGIVFKGSYVSIDASNTSDAIVLGDDAQVAMLGFRWAQPAVASGWQPRAFGWAVRITGVRATARDLFILNPTKGIEVASAASGPVLIDHVFGSPQAIGLHLDTNATVRANDLHFWPFWGLGGAYGNIVAPHVESTAKAFVSDHSASAEVSNAFSIGYQLGLELGSANGKASTDFRLWNADQDVGVRGYVVSGAGTQATFANFSAQGDTSTSTPGVTGVWVEPGATGTQLRGYNGDLRIFTGNAVRSDASGADVRVNLMRMDGFGRGGAFPATEGVAAGPETDVNGN